VFRHDVESVHDELLPLENPFALWLMGRVDQMLSTSGYVLSVDEIRDTMLGSEPAGWTPQHVAQVMDLLAGMWTNPFARELAMTVARYGIESRAATSRANGSSGRASSMVARSNRPSRT
jgi:hypothetical protein